MAGLVLSVSGAVAGITVLLIVIIAVAVLACYSVVLLLLLQDTDETHYPELHTVLASEQPTSRTITKMYSDIIIIS